MSDETRRLVGMVLISFSENSVRPPEDFIEIELDPFLDAKGVAVRCDLTKMYN